MSGRKIIKVSSPWSRIDNKTRVSTVNPSGRYEYVFDKEKEVIECDYWIVWGGIKGVKEKTICPPENIIYLTDEVHEQRFFNKYFLNQFPSIVTCRKDIPHKHVIGTHELNTWMVDRDYDWLHADKDIPKPKTISVISSDQVWLPGHKLRYAFVNKLIGHFKDKLDVYGRGFRPIDDKFDALADYKYSIAIENSVIPGYFTEKIADCYLTHTMPLYYGCPDIQQYFDEGSFTLIDPHDLKGAIETIERVIEEDPYQQALPSLIRQKKKYLEGYQIFNKLLQVLDAGCQQSGNKKTVSIRNERCFQRGYTFNKMVDDVFRILPLPKRLYFQVSLDQIRTIANK